VRRDQSPLPSHYAGYLDKSDPLKVKEIGSEPAAQLVLDPFSGLATVGQTAIHLGHRFVGIDLNSKYLDVAAKRIGKTPRWKMRRLAQEGKKVAKSANNGRQESLF
jgi:hypothetical protein